jgi:hypothetical protein
MDIQPYLFTCVDDQSEHIRNINSFQTYLRGPKFIRSIVNHLRITTKYNRITVSSIRLTRNPVAINDYSPPQQININKGDSTLNIVYARTKYLFGDVYSYHMFLLVIDEQRRTCSYINPNGNVNRTILSPVEIGLLKTKYNLDSMTLLVGTTINTDMPKYKQVNRFRHDGWCQFIVFYIVVKILVSGGNLRDIYTNLIDLHNNNPLRYYTEISNFIKWTVLDFEKLR